MTASVKKSLKGICDNIESGKNYNQVLEETLKELDEVLTKYYRSDNTDAPDKKPE